MPPQRIELQALAENGNYAGMRIHRLEELMYECLPRIIIKLINYCVPIGSGVSGGRVRVSRPVRSCSTSDEGTSASFSGALSRHIRNARLKPAA
jgi:hypothetical protein